MFGDQLKLAGERSIPITIAVLLIVLGSLVAVGIPILLAASGVLATIGLVKPIDVEVNASHDVARVTIPLVGSGVDSTSNDALNTLRNDVLPATIGKVPNASFAVTGTTAQSVDQNSLLKSKAPIVFGFVLIFAFALLLVTFRSIVIALKAIVLNLLSVAAAYGAMILIFQYGWGESLFDFTSNGGIAYWLPIFLFVILFGLSMDYHILILTRVVREAYDRGLSTEEAVEHGISTMAASHQRSAGDGRRLRRVRADADPRHEGDGHRPGRRGADRRHDHPRGAAAGVDEAARRLELVPAQLARVAATPRAGHRRRSASGRGSTGPRSLGRTRRARPHAAPVAEHH